MAIPIKGGGATPTAPYKPPPLPSPSELAGKGWFGYLPPKPAVAPLPTVDLSWMNGAVASGVGDLADPLAGAFAGGGGAAAEPAGAFLDPMSNPEYLQALAGIDAAEASSIGGIRTRQDAARRALDNLLGDIANREGKGLVRTKESQEQRGLLRSGATERLLGDVSEAAGDERARGESSTADQIAQLEQAIAEAKMAAEKERGSTKMRFAGLTA